MPYRITIEMVSRPATDLLESALAIVASRNAEWYLEQWAAGNEPPHDPVAAGVVWSPDCPAYTATFETAPLVFERRIASCGPIAAVLTGYAQARAIYQGADIHAAAAQHRVQLIQLGAAAWHAVYDGPNGQVDATRRMTRSNRTCL